MQILSSLSGLQFSAASAGYAPTNSGDVSAIASAYQVVSATATQLYAGTSYLTSVNGAPISAARAGNAANASLANSAWYDGTGRFISALPDSAAVSAIASSYVESGVSSKQDTLSFAYNTADQISSINGSALGGMDEAAVSGIASAYAESAVSSKADSSALSSYVPYSSLEYNTASAISGINGSALAAGSTYSAGEGIDITDDVISVEAPVDIVAGPGIVIDNPDGNTLRVSVEADAETVLCTETSQTNTHTLSESPYNFKYLRFEFFANSYTSLSTDAVLVPMKSGITAINMLHGIPSTANWGMVNELFTVSSSAITMTHSHRLLNNWSTNSITHQQDAVSTVKQIVGIHRTASN